MFSINPNFMPIRSYDQAVKSWQSGVIFPKDRKLGDLALPRGLVDTRKRHMTIERTATLDYILRLYSHPVVTWHQDNSVTISPYLSRSTVMFANCCTPISMFVALHNGQFSVTCAGRIYKVERQLTLRKRGDAWEPDQVMPWSVPFINRERATYALRETGYKEFRLWFMTYVQMAEPPMPGYSYLDGYQMLRMLQDRNQWRELVRKCGSDAWKYPNKILDKLRHAIYREYDCVEQKNVPYLKSNYDLPSE